MAETGFEHISAPLLINIKGTLTDLSVPRVMGILNITPDSFFDGGRYNSTDKAMLQAEKMIEEGAFIVDLGGQSTRPGAQTLTAEEELRIVLPVAEALVRRFPDTVFSVDTFYARVAEECIKTGFSMINDVSGGNWDEAMLDTAASLKVPYIAMHAQGKPENMQKNPTYENVVTDLLKFFAHKIDECNRAGITDLIIDPGFGFGKTLEHNYRLLNQLGNFLQFGKPVLAGLSRKSMVWKLLGTDAESSLSGTIAANTVALMNGASLLRVHDVKDAVAAIRVVEACRR